MRMRLLGMILTPLIGLSMAACSVEKKEDGSLPDVDVQGGKLPEYDVDAPDVTIKKDTQTVVVPKIEVGSPDSSGDTTRHR